MYPANPPVAGNVGLLRICNTECKARDWDLKYMKKYVPDTVFKRFKGMDHGDMALFYPERMARELLNL